MEVFEYCVFLDEKRDKDDEVTEEAVFLVPVDQILCRNKEQAMLKAAKAIPDEHMDKLDRIQVAVRPF